jgi:hypothetical protein
MLTLAEVTELLTVDEREPMWIRGAYNKLLSLSFLEVPFEVNWTEETKTPYYSHFTVLVDTTGRFSFKPAFILFILPKSSSRSRTSRKEAEDKLKGLLKEADTPFTIMHGACVSSSRMAFYSYNRQLEVFTPESHLQGQFFDFDLTEDAGAGHMLKVIEEVKDMCRELLGELKVRADNTSWTSRLWSVLFG